MPSRLSKRDIGYREGYISGYLDCKEGYPEPDPNWVFAGDRQALRGNSKRSVAKPKRKLSAWNKYVKANSKKPRFRYRNGKLNLKKMAVAFRKTRKRGGKR